MATRHTFTGPGQQFNGTTEGEQQGVMGRVRAAGEAVQSQAEHVVTDYPISTVLAVFGIGLGVGVVLGSAMFSSSSSSSSSSWLPSGSSSSWLPSSSSNWFPSMSSNSSSWLPSSSNGSWFGNSHNSSNWGDSLMRGAKSMCGY